MVFPSHDEVVCLIDKLNSICSVEYDMKHIYSCLSRTTSKQVDPFGNVTFNLFNLRKDEFDQLVQLASLLAEKRAKLENGKTFRWF